MWVQGSEWRIGVERKTCKHALSNQPHPKAFGCLILQGVWKPHETHEGIHLRRKACVHQLTPLVKDLPHDINCSLPLHFWDWVSGCWVVPAESHDSMASRNKAQCRKWEAEAWAWGEAHSGYAVETEEVSGGEISSRRGQDKMVPEFMPEFVFKIHSWYIFNRKC